MHELKELVDDRLEELPVGAQEAGVLAHDVHDVGGDDVLVVLAPLLLAQAQQVLEHTHTHHSQTFECTTHHFCQVWTLHQSIILKNPSDLYN